MSDSQIPWLTKTVSSVGRTRIVWHYRGIGETLGDMFFGIVHGIFGVCMVYHCFKMANEGLGMDSKIVLDIFGTFQILAKYRPFHLFLCRDSFENTRKTWDHLQQILLPISQNYGNHFVELLEKAGAET